MRLWQLPLALLCFPAVACTVPATVGGILDERPEDAAPGDGGTVDGGSSCVDAELELTAAAFGLLLVVDDDASSATSWAAVRGGIARFLGASQPVDFSVGLQRLLPTCDEARPPDVPLAPVAEATEAIVAALPAAALATNSLIPGLRASLDNAADWSEAHADARAAVVLLTDASPGTCEGAYPNHVAAAEDAIRLAVQGNPRLEVHVIATGALLTPNNLASAAGTELISLGLLTSDVLVEAALTTVRERVGSCERALPPGRVLAASSQVILRDDTGAAHEYDIVADAGSCNPGGFFPKSGDPQALVACPATCTDLAASGTVSLQGSCSAM